jgi:hypothetical protein
MVGNCDIDYFNCHRRQVQIIEIVNQSERNQNFAVNFWKHWKQKRKWTNYIATEWKKSIIPRKFHEILLVLWNIINFCKMSVNDQNLSLHMNMKVT